MSTTPNPSTPNPSPPNPSSPSPSSPTYSSTQISTTPSASSSTNDHQPAHPEAIAIATEMEKYGLIWSTYWLLLTKLPTIPELDKPLLFQEMYDAISFTESIRDLKFHSTASEQMDMSLLPQKRAEVADMKYKVLQDLGGVLEGKLGDVAEGVRTVVERLVELANGDDVVDIADEVEEMKEWLEEMERDGSLVNN